MDKPDSKGKFLSIVIPLYCESDTLGKLLSEIYSTLEPLGMPYELILVDDGSEDNTWAAINEGAKKYPAIRAIRFSKNFGKESAICAGLEASKGDAVIVMDGDLQHPPNLIPQMLNLWSESKADVIEAIKSNRGNESYMNKLGANVFYFMLKKLSGHDLTNLTDYKLMDSRVVKAWLQMGERNLFFRGMSSWLGFRRVQVPFEVPGRTGGKSAMSFSRLMKLAINGITAFSSVPLHLVTILGGVFLIFALIVGVEAVYMKMIGEAQSGFPTVILLLLIIGSLLMITMGIIGVYIAKIYEEVKRRPRYIVANTIDKQENVKTD